MERYKTLKVVGDGTFGTVFKATNRATGEICAIKKMKKPFSSWDECLNLREVKSLRKFNSPFIVKLKEVFRVNDELHLVFEFMEENLYELIKDRAQGLPEPQIKSIISQILQGLVYMHKHGFFHRDLKPENLMITGTSVKITDFGLAREIRSKPPFTDYVSTRWYRAPEILLRSTAYNSPVDLFALGCIMAELFTLRPLAPGNNETDQILRFCAILGSPSVNSWPDGFKLASDMGFRFPNHQPIGLANLVPNASPEALEVMSALLQWDPHKRPTAVEALRFSFFEVKEEPKGGEGSLRTSSKWSHGSSRITGNSSKGKWSFKATFSSKELILPQLRENHEARAGRVKVDVVEKEQKLPSLYRKTPTRKISRERMAYNKAEILSPRGLQPKFFTNHLVSPKNPIKLPPIPSLNHTGNVLRKQGSRGQLLNNY
jgi:protein kinase